MTCSATETTLEPETLFQELSSITHCCNSATYFQDLDAVVNSGIEIDMVGSNTSSDTNLEVLSLSGEMHTRSSHKKR